MRYFETVVNTPSTPLAKKLGIVTGSRLVLLGMPDPLDLDLPPEVTVRRQARGAADVVLAFFTEVIALEAAIERLAAMVFPSGGLWTAWPKRTSKLETDLTDHEVRRIALPLGLVDNKVCAIDNEWTGLRLVWRREHRGIDGPPGSKP